MCQPQWASRHLAWRSLVIALPPFCHTSARPGASATASARRSRTTWYARSFHGIRLRDEERVEIDAALEQLRRALDEITKPS